MQFTFVFNWSAAVAFTIDLTLLLLFCGVAYLWYRRRRLVSFLCTGGLEGICWLDMRTET